MASGDIYVQVTASQRPGGKSRSVIVLVPDSVRQSFESAEQSKRLEENAIAQRLAEPFAKHVCFLTLALLCTVDGLAQMPNPYGPPINLENAKKLAVPAVAEATRNGWMIAVAVVDPAGNLVYFEKMDNTQFASAEISIQKA